MRLQVTIHGDPVTIDVVTLPPPQRVLLKTTVERLRTGVRIAAGVRHVERLYADAFGAWALAEIDRKFTETIRALTRVATAMALQCIRDYTTQVDEAGARLRGGLELVAVVTAATEAEQLALGHQIIEALITPDPDPPAAPTVH